MKIASLLPAATEMACALGLDEAIVGVSHECNFPEAMASRPRVTRSLLPAGLDQAGIDAFVTARLRNGDPLYGIDETLLSNLAPDLILAQDLCAVCGVSSKELDGACDSLPAATEILRFSPHSLAEIIANIRELARVTGREHTAEAVIAEAETQIAEIKRRVEGLPRPRVFCMEWLEPPYCSGHWVPEMVEIAGGVDALGRKGTDSVRVAWSDIQAWAPEIIVLMPCGFSMDAAARQTGSLPSVAGWTDLPAAKAGHVYVVDADAYFARPGPRIFTGIALLARIIHPHLESPASVPPALRLQTKRCESCSKPFFCQSASTGCWCEDRCLSTGELRTLSETYGDCLCPACLGGTTQPPAHESPSLAGSGRV